MFSLSRGFALSLMCAAMVMSVGCGRGGEVAAPTVSATSTLATPTTAPDESGRIIIDNFSFKPATLTIPVGATVTWVNQDDVPHTATANAKPRAFDSGSLDTDQQFSFVFKTPGSYPYFCAVHPHMTGLVIVK
jgi:plastocyanin